MTTKDNYKADSSTSTRSSAGLSQDTGGNAGVTGTSGTGTGGGEDQRTSSTSEGRGGDTTVETNSRGGGTNTDGGLGSGGNTKTGFGSGAGAGTDTLGNGPIGETTGGRTESESMGKGGQLRERTKAAMNSAMDVVFTTVASIINLARTSLVGWDRPVPATGSREFDGLGIS